MISHNGNIQMLDDDLASRIMRAEAQLPDGAILAHGTEADIRAIANRVRLGHDELEARKARRKQQRKSRRTNR